MKNSGTAIPWTHRDSRPRSQAELDLEESFDVSRRLKIPKPHDSDLHQRLEHYQAMITKLLTDAAFREEMDIATETCGDRAQRAVKRTVFAAKTVPGILRQTSKRRASTQRTELNARQSDVQDFVKQDSVARNAPREPAQTNFFTHLDRVFSGDVPPDAHEPTDAELETLYSEYHLFTPELREQWKAALIALARDRISRQQRNNTDHI